MRRWVPTSDSSDVLSVRQRKIIEVLNTAGFISVRDLAAALGVSEMTTRRDLRSLSANGHARLVHGGATLTHGTLRTQGFVARAAVGRSAKAAIAAAAAGQTARGSTIAIDAGTTAFALTEHLTEMAPKVVITNSIPIIQLSLSRDDYSLVVLGGEVEPESQALVGPLSVQNAEELKADTLFLGAAAIDAGGIYVRTGVERPTKLALMSSAKRVVLLADSGKFSTSAPVRLCGLEHVDVLVTDQQPPRHVEMDAEKASTEIVVADNDHM